MSEPKRIHRMAPCSQFDIAATQAWVEDMAKKGWHLEKDGYFAGFFAFTQGEPKAIRCRLEATDTDGSIFSETWGPDVDALSLYQNMGWNWVGRRGQFHIYVTDDPGAPELHTDPRVQAMTIKALTKFFRNALANTIITFLLDFYLILDGHIALFAVALGFWPTVFAAALLLSVPLGQLWNVIRFYRLRKQLEQGLVPPQRKTYGKFRWFYYLRKPVLTVLAIVCIGSPLIALADQQQDLEDWNKPMPFATLEDIFPDARVENDTGFMDGGSVNTFSDWFTPVNMEYSQHANITLPDQPTFWGDIRVLYHETKYDWFARMVAKEHETDINGGFFDQLFTEEVEITPLEGLDADYAIMWQDVYHYILICQGNQVVRFSYNHRIAEHYTPEEIAQIVLDSLGQT